MVANITDKRAVVERFAAGMIVWAFRHRMLRVMAAKNTRYQYQLRYDIAKLVDAREAEQAAERARLAQAEAERASAEYALAAERMRHLRTRREITTLVTELGELERSAASGWAATSDRRRRLEAAAAAEARCKAEAQVSEHRGQLLIKAEARRVSEQAIWHAELRDVDSKLAATDALAAQLADALHALAASRAECAERSSEVEAARTAAADAHADAHDARATLRTREAGFARAWAEQAAAVDAERASIAAERKAAVAAVSAAEGAAQRAERQALDASREIERLAASLARVQLYAHAQEKTAWHFAHERRVEHGAPAQGGAQAEALAARAPAPTALRRPLSAGASAAGGIAATPSRRPQSAAGPRPRSAVERSDYPPRVHNDQTPHTPASPAWPTDARSPQPAPDVQTRLAVDLARLTPARTSSPAAASALPSTARLGGSNGTRARETPPGLLSFSPYERIRTLSDLARSVRR